MQWLRASDISALRPTVLLVATVTLAGAILRFFHLDTRSFWLDEATTAQVIGLSSLGEVVAWVQGWVDQAPLFFFITWLLRPLGDSEEALRLPSVVAGTAAIPATYLLARQLFGSRVGLFSTVLMATLPFVVWYSQEARPYSLLILTTTGQMLFAYRVVTVGRRGDWIGLVAFSTANLYTHLVAIAATLSAAIFVALGVITTRQRWKPFALCGITVLLVYAPWLSSLQRFLDRKDVGFGRYSTSRVVTLDEVWSLLDSFGFTGLIFGLLVLGAIVALVRGRRDRGLAVALLALWLGLPVVALALRLHGGFLDIPSRYLAFLIPAALIVVALGADQIARWLAIIIDRVAAVRFAPLASSVVLVMIFVQIVPALQRSYSRANDDYRGAATYVTSRGAADSVVIALGEHSDYAVIGLGYYLRRMHSQVAVVNGALLDGTIIGRMQQQHGPVWAVFVWPTPAEERLISTSGLELRHFLNIVMVDSVATRSPIDQAELLLKWAVRVQPQLLSSVELIRLLTGEMSLGPNLLAVPTMASRALGEGRWYLASGSAVAGMSFRLAPEGGETNVSYKTRLVTGGGTYAISFEFANDQLVGWQHVYVSTHDSADNWLQIFPTGYGYSCRPSHGWSRAIFAFSMPAQATSLTVWLRAHGTGQSEFRDVRLAPLLETGQDRRIFAQQV